MIIMEMRNLIKFDQNGELARVILFYKDSKVDATGWMHWTEALRVYNEQAKIWDAQAYTS